MNGISTSAKMYELNLVTGLLFFVCAELCCGERILMISWPQYSHTSGQVAIGSELVKLGDEVALATVETFSVDKLVQDTGIDVITFKPPASDLPQLHGDEFEDYVIKTSLDITTLANSTHGDDVSRRCLIYCDAMLSDSVFMEKVRQKNFDLMLIDALYFIRCLVLLPKKLGIPFVTESPAQMESFASGAPFWPASQPSFLLGHSPTELAGIFGRLLSFTEQAVLNFVDLPSNGTWLIEKHLHGVNQGYRDIIAESLFWIHGTMDLVMDFPKATTPNTALVGGLTTKPAKPLNRDLEAFMSSAEDGVIVFSFGSIVKKIPPVYLQRFLDAFARLKQKVIMRVSDGSVLKASENVRLEKWLPQNDLLGHKNTKLFVSHGGANSVYEALYHGVPMLATPISPSDQRYNAKKMEYKGFGLSLDFLKLTPDDVYEAVTTIS